MRRILAALATVTVATAVLVTGATAPAAAQVDPIGVLCDLIPGDVCVQ
ncbi:hypothetical protein [Nonomuraea candida]|nr:hypothetical protein [Nonomuraea candida]